MSTRIDNFKDLGKAVVRHRSTALLEGALRGEPASLRQILTSSGQEIPNSHKQQIAGHVYEMAKHELAGCRFEQARRALCYAAALQPGNNLIQERAFLTGRLVAAREPIRWKQSLQDLLRSFRSICTKEPCVCSSHFQVAHCRRFIEDGYPCRDLLGDVPTYTLNAYHAWTKAGEVTKALKIAKGGMSERSDITKSELLEEIADIASDFLLEKTDLLKAIDILVPIAPSPEKVAKRDGLAPNDVVAARLSQRLALPLWKALNRVKGPPTREASDEELSKQFSVPSAVRTRLKGVNILLVEDIWTRGRTIPICAEKLRECEPGKIFAVALAHSTR
jgi:predicted amidophosphoribosyltransferase